MLGCITGSGSDAMTVLPVTANSCFDFEDTDIGCGTAASDYNLNTARTLVKDEHYWRTEAATGMDFSESTRQQRI